MGDMLHTGVTLSIILMATASIAVRLTEWTATSARLVPWLRLQSWWPVAADHKAETLLRNSLTREEYRSLRTHAYIEVASPSYARRVYRIPRGPGQVAVYEGGHVTERLCLQPLESLPEADVVLMHKLLIEADEPRYLATANHFPRAVWR